MTQPRMRFDADHFEVPGTNMFGVLPCPKCKSVYRWPTQHGTIQCDDCGLTQPMPRQPVADDAIPADTHVTAPVEIRRLAGQSAAILARLQAGPATARELAALSLNYRARLSDLRAAGYRIPPPVEDVASGVSVYRLEPA